MQSYRRGKANYNTSRGILIRIAVLGHRDGRAGDRRQARLPRLSWPDASILDLSDITTARGTEMAMAFWLRLFGTIGRADFNYHIQIANRDASPGIS